MYVIYIYIGLYHNTLFIFLSASSSHPPFAPCVSPLTSNPLPQVFPSSYSCSDCWLLLRLVAELCLNLCDPLDCGLPGLS